MSPARDHSARSVLLGLAGLTFAAFPLLRPWGDKTGGAADMTEAFADPRWVLAHCLGMLAWVLLAGSLLTTRDPASPRHRPDRAAALVAVGVALILPYYGAETFGLHGLAAHAVASGDLGALGAQAEIRGGVVQSATFATGLLLLGIGSLLWARVRSGSGSTRRAWVGPLRWIAALGVATYLPQFFLPPDARTVHGLVLGSALVLVAWGSKLERADRMQPASH